jgi:lysylphosphatidylglycerol synthetase-like protein (DUF2156 family)
MEPNPDSTEPLITASVLTAAATAAVALLVAFGLHLTPEQSAAIVGVVSVLAPLVVALIARRKVYSPATVARLLAAKRPAE